MRSLFPDEQKENRLSLVRELKDRLESDQEFTVRDESWVYGYVPERKM